MDAAFLDLVTDDRGCKIPCLAIVSFCRRSDCCYSGNFAAGMLLSDLAVRDLFVAEIAALLPSNSCEGCTVTWSPTSRVAWIFTST